MKDKEKKNKKHHESTIGKIIYGFLLFLPLLAIGVTCGYAIFNKNAKDSYYGTLTNNETYIQQNMLSISNNQFYYLNTQNYSNNGNNFMLYCNEFEVIDGGNLTTSAYATLTTHSNIRINCRNTTPEFYIINEDNTTTWVTNSASFVSKFKINNTSSDTRSATTGFYTIQYEELTYISEVFYYSVDRITQSNLFNWTQNTSIYTTINQFTNNLGITNTFMPLLLTYWLIISIVYFLYDIVLMILIVLHKKIHELQDTI